MNISFDWDPSMASAPAGFEAALGTIAQQLDALILDPINVTLNVGYGVVEGGAMTAGDSGSGGPSSAGTFINYTQLHDILSGSNAVSQAEIAALPSDWNTQLSGSAFISSAQAKAWGVMDNPFASVDGYVGFGSSYDWSLSGTPGTGQVSLQSVALHEMTHALGRIYGDGAERLVQYTAPGRFSPLAGGGYMSVDGGTTNLAAFSSVDTTDFAGAVSDDGNAFKFVTPLGATGRITDLDKEELAALGFNVAGIGAAVPPPIAPPPVTPPVTPPPVVAPPPVVVPPTPPVSPPPPAPPPVVPNPVTLPLKQPPAAPVTPPLTGTEVAVTQLYQGILGRAPDTSGLDYWSSTVDAGRISLAGVAQVLTGSPEFIHAEVYRLYQTSFGRAPDAPGEAYWSDVMSKGATIGQVALDFTSTAEFLADYGRMSNADFVSAIYHDTLHRAPDGGGAQYWNGLLNTGTSRAVMLTSFSESTESRMLTVVRS